MSNSNSDEHKAALKDLRARRDSAKAAYEDACAAVERAEHAYRKHETAQSTESSAFPAKA